MALSWGKGLAPQPPNAHSQALSLWEGGSRGVYNKGEPPAMSLTHNHTHRDVRAAPRVSLPLALCSRVCELLEERASLVTWETN